MKKKPLGLGYKFRVVEFYKGGEKRFVGKQYRQGWRVYKSIKAGEWIFDKDLPEK